MRNLGTERKLGTVLADWPEEAVDVASATGYRGFYVEPCGSGDPTETDCVVLAAQSSASAIASFFRPSRSNRRLKAPPVNKAAKRSEVED